MDFLTNFSIYEVTTWALQKTNAILNLNQQNAELANQVSNFLLFSYLIAYFFNRKGCYIAAFFVVEIISVFDFYSNPNGYLLYVAYCFYYFFIYWYGVKNFFRLKTIFWYAMLMLFQFCMAIDAYYYSEVNTPLWAYYEYFIMVFHLCVISSLCKWKDIRGNLELFITSFVRSFSGSYNFTFIWYTIIKK